MSSRCYCYYCCCVHACMHARIWMCCLREMGFVLFPSLLTAAPPAGPASPAKHSVVPADELGGWLSLLFGSDRPHPCI